MATKGCLTADPNIPCGRPVPSELFQSCHKVFCCSHAVGGEIRPKTDLQGHYLKWEGLRPVRFVLKGFFTGPKGSEWVCIYI